MLSHVLAAQLEVLGIGTLGTDLFAEHAPEDISCTWLIGSTRVPIPTQSGKVAMARHTVQINSRQDTPSAAYNAVDAAVGGVLTIGNDTVGGVWISQATLLNGPFSQRRDDDGRYIYTANVLVEASE